MLLQTIKDELGSLRRIFTTANWSIYQGEYLPCFSPVVRRKLINRFKANLTKTLSKSSDTNQGKLRNYAYFKTIFQKETYLSIINNVDIRKCSMSFRKSAHKLEIEVGRYKKMPALNKICKICLSGEVEDERHLIFSCNKYSSLRQSFFTETQKICKNFSTLTQNARFFWLMNNESEGVIILFSNYKNYLIVSNLEMCAAI